MPWDPIGQTLLVEDWNCYLNYHQFDFCKTTDLEEDSPEEVDILEEVQVSQVLGHLAEDGACHLHLYCKATTENWLEKCLPSSTETENKHKCSSTSGSCIGALTMTTQ